jgi:hypothetical protein
MKKISELLRDADPLPIEPSPSPDQIDLCRHAVISEVGNACVPGRLASRSRIVLAAVVLTMIAASFLGTRVWSLFVGDLQAAVRFEVRLAEDKPAPGLREAKLSGSNRSVYLHEEIIVTNSDIAVTRVLEGPSPWEYAVGIEFNATGAEKMRAATGKHIGKPIAILFDGQVVMAPTLRTPISASARITDNFTRSEAEKIVKGIEIR